MEKLVELLNEYDNGDYQVYSWRNVGNQIIAKNLPLKYELDTNESGAILISKDYEFIKRLVENDYINMNKVERDAINYFTDESPVYGDKIWTTRLIMMLSVSNSPIKDLIYYLCKEDDEHYIKPGGYKLVFNAKKS